MESEKIFSGSEILAQALQVKLEDVGIASWTKNNVQSAISAGFGIINQAVDVYVAQSDVDKAKRNCCRFQFEDLLKTYFGFKKKY